MQKLRTFYAKVTDFLCKSYGLFMQKLRTFYVKVTDFLESDKPVPSGILTHDYHSKCWMNSFF